MNEETIVAIYDTPAHADAAVRDLQDAGVLPDAIARHGADAGTAPSAGTPTRERGFWSSLFGTEPDHDTTVYDRSIESGSSIVTVRVPVEHVARVTDILDRHNPIDIDERAAGYGVGRASSDTAATLQPVTLPNTAGLAEPGLAPLTGRSPRDTAYAGEADRDGVYGSGEAVIPLSEEELSVGKRTVDRGTTRVRRFVVETPVEQDVTLHSERVTIERRPVTGRTATAPEFTDRVIEMSETDEEVVVSKTAHVVEEVVVHKDATDRVETIRDTVRREEVEIDQDRTAGR
ncbi:YsnF/AvaK domain-containing protein [Lichenicola sp.]|uniref:YsnF/AvaK domain-containing protein n=1 Tax=Lichenicola sp. TaxID=2804529 RepID=UPI003AFF89DE